jgi:hypothetical protein
MERKSEMSNTQLYLSIGIPSFTVILALLIALFQNNRLSDKMDRMGDRLSDKIDAANAEHHGDFKMLVEQLVRLNERIARVEN